MATLKLRGKDLRAIGYPEGPVISIALNVMHKNFARNSREHALGLLKKVIESPEAYRDDEIFGAIAVEVVPKEVMKKEGILLNREGVHVDVFGAKYIEEGAMIQIEQASKLPVSVAGALMPDAHAGYGLPIGGVLATQNAVIPYGVGVDIGCRMCLSIYDIDPYELKNKEKYFIRELNAATLFGSGQQFDRITDHPILQHSAFRELAVLSKIYDRVTRQLGTSGSGNHFVEFGIVEIDQMDDVLKVPPGKYVGLLSHSGSRALGANIANHYTHLAKEKRHLPAEAANLAWLNMNEEAGQEYWIAMNVAGDYASACHHVIHDKIASQLGRQPVRVIENHHNFAWKEVHDGKEVIVHRKGATPAGKDVLGIIPGSMTSPGFIVKGKGETSSINSASHGAGRRMSRTKAISSITEKDLKEALSRHGVTLIGGGLDEAPQAYKNIEDVMKSQHALVDVTGKFTPKIVKMDATPPRYKKRKTGMVAGE
jgi:tRNA-splicing ligase RtcB